MNKDLFASSPRIDVAGVQYVVLFEPVQGVAMAFREIDLDGGADVLTPFLIEMPPQEPAV